MSTLRDEFAATMTELGIADQRLVVMVGDISHGILQNFARACPGRYYNIGICEPTIVNMAAGLNKVGLIPVVHTIAPFITERAFEQIKLDFGYQKLSVNIVSVGSSFDYSQLGCSHHCYTDISLLSHLRRAVVMMPSGNGEFRTLFNQVYDNGMINYFRLTENAHGVQIPDSSIVVGRGVQIDHGDDLTIAAVGSQLKTAVAAASILSSEGISVDLLYFHTLKPFDHELLRESVARTRRLISIEELSAHDGLFNLCLRATVGVDGLVCKSLAVSDFIHGYGTYEELCARAGLGLNDLLLAARPMFGKR